MSNMVSIWKQHDLKIMKSTYVKIERCKNKNDRKQVVNIGKKKKSLPNNNDNVIPIAINGGLPTCENTQPHIKTN